MSVDACQFCLRRNPTNCLLSMNKSVYRCMFCNYESVKHDKSCSWTHPDSPACENGHRSHNIPGFLCLRTYQKRSWKYVNTTGKIGKVTTTLSLIWIRFKGHVTRSNFSCNLQRNVCCVASCKKQFACNTPFCNCNCCVASCKKGRMTLYFSQRCETNCLRVTSPQQLATTLATQFFQNGPIRAHLSLARDSAILFVIVRVASCEKSCKRVTPPLQLEMFFIRHRCVASCKGKLLRVTWP